MGVPAPGELRITELLINPAGGDVGREWIEIENIGQRRIAIGALHVADRVGDAATEWTTSVPILPASGRALLLQSLDPTRNGGIDGGGGSGDAPFAAGRDGGAAGTASGSVAAPFIAGSYGTRVTLNNDGDSVFICAGPCGPGTIIDSVSWERTLGVEYDGNSLSRDEGGRDCPGALSFGDGTSRGTPGLPNPPCP